MALAKGISKPVSSDKVRKKEMARISVFFIGNIHIRVIIILYLHIPGQGPGNGMKLKGNSLIIITKLDTRRNGGGEQWPENLRKFHGWREQSFFWTACFAAGTLLWFHTVQPEEVQVTKNPTAQTSQPAEEPEAPGMLEGEVLDLNTATLSDLMRLPGIGEKKGSAILAWRQEKGGFSAVEELLEVKGIGEATLERLRPYVTVGVPAVEKGGDHGTDSGG